MILTGVALLFICPFPFLIKPSTTVCIFRGSLPGIALLTCYAPLFLKIIRNVFVHAQKSPTMPRLLSSKFLLFCSFKIVAIQFLLSGVWIASKTPNADSVLDHNRDYNVITCNGQSSPALKFLNLVLSVIFVISSTVLALKTRHVPANYHESKYIAITLCATCVAWAPFFPGYFFASSENMGFLREYLICIVCVLIRYITLLGLFGPKLKVLLFISKEKLGQKSNESQSLSFFLPPRTDNTNGVTMKENIYENL